MHELAVIIPAFKITYFRAALEALAAQTCPDFTVYIGDDCSPDNLREVADSFAGRLDISYTRFEKNMGARDLVLQWKRSIALSREEKWIWLFSDDDLVDPTCVENFLRIAERNQDRFDIYRFNSEVVDGTGKVIRKLPQGPPEESSEQMAYYLLMDKRGNAMQDHIFSREVYNKAGGIVYTEYAQGADWATSILFSREKGIAIIPEAKFYWRLSDLNVSGSAFRTRKSLFEGHLQFITWVMQHFSYLQQDPSPSISFDMIREAARFNLVNVVIWHYKGLSFNNLLKIIPFMHHTLQQPYKRIAYDLQSIFVSTSRAGSWYMHGAVFVKRMMRGFRSAPGQSK